MQAATMAACVACGADNPTEARFCMGCGAPRDPRVEVPEQRKTVTALFCDIVGSTTLGESQDPEVVRAMLTRYFDRMRGIVEAHGGTVEKFIGDAVVAVFGVPLVHEDDALRALRAAAEMREALPQLGVEARLGVNTGEVVTSGDDTLVTGDAVNVAARLEQAAAPGEILIGAQTRLLAGDALSAEELAPLELKGKLEPVAAYRLLAVHETSARSYEPADHVDAVFMGRRRELSWLRKLAAGVIAGGSTRRLTIVGEAGIGKSRLAREFLAGLGPRTTVLVGRCPPYGEGITFWPVREILRQAGRDNEALPSSSHEVFARVRQVIEELAAAQPVVVLFDDLHWAEPTFLDLVEYLAARLGPARVILLCLARPQFAEQRPAWLEPPADGLTLEPLSVQDSRRLIESLGTPVGLRARIAEAAEGNPLFVEQLATIANDFGATDAMPETIRSVLHERLDHLNRGERSVSNVRRSSVVRQAGHGARADGAGGRPAGAGAAVLARWQAIRPAGRARPRRELPLRTRAHSRCCLRRDAEVASRRPARADGCRLDSQGEEDALVGFHLKQAFLLRHSLRQADAELALQGGTRLRVAGQAAIGRSDAPAAVSLFERARVLVPRGDVGLPGLLTELAYVRRKLGDFTSAHADLDEAIDAAARLETAGPSCAR